jgi:ABC-type sulfate/molybdate transport systems ATPase subunit
VSIGCRDLWVTVGGRTLVAVSALDIEAGETLAVLGPNGAGKSTLLRALAHLDSAPRSGTVLLDGETATTNDLRLAVAAVLQRPVLQRTSVLDNAAAGLRLRGVRRAEARERAEPWLEALGVAHLAGRHARTLSGGEAQRVAIARALAVDPPLLLLDEPTASLDPARRNDLGDTLRALARSGRALVMTSHDDDFVREFATRVVVLANGAVVEQGDPHAVLTTPQHPATRELLQVETARKR